MLRWSDVRVLYWRELRSAMRERNIVINSILLPIFLYPLILWLVYSGITFVEGQTEGFKSRIMLRGLSQAHEAFRLVLEEDDSVLVRSSTQPKEELRAGTLDLLAEFLPPTHGRNSSIDNFHVRLVTDRSKDRSRIARNRIMEHLDHYREQFLEAEGQLRGLSPSALQQFWIETQNISSRRQMGQFILGLILPLFLVIMLCVGSMYPAIDSTAGEREKLTWETLLTTAASRTSIVVAKYLYVATMASIAGILNITAMALSMRTVLAPLLGGRIEDMSFQVHLGAIPLILLVTALLALFIAAGMMILASFARTFKEGQSMVTPFYIAAFLPAMFLQVPGLKLTPLLASIPVVNVTMVFREAMAGTFQWPLIGLTLLTELLSILGALWLAANVLRYEDFLLGTFEGSFGKFLKNRIWVRPRNDTRGGSDAGSR